ncbi:GNAT family N-acetyltransferase [Alicyclobacillus mengziensis]|uniref:GNAT family N-acetyltransferase n=1 Tax=Alicyclobacillus mengziensis TaxID=2931921 RepID=A0A9X7W2G1_9BACL|nr:GNAT family N-acetyltransferase [Alicyclobacillus mengziensis]QSO48957.1 GNAT family N-acetyltransferase [Alicyclobacillus mengziensis]
MTFYDRLSNYFPDHELKHEGQMNELIDDHEAYKVHEDEDFVVTYADFPDFIFIDYLLVSPKTRGKGTGTKVLDTFKKRGKTIILEVEPPDADDTDTLKRIRFYEKNGFQRAEHIEYTRSDDDGTPHTMDVYYWSPDDVSQRSILKQMATVCREIHNFEAMKYYGRLIAEPDEVLDWQH